MSYGGKLLYIYQRLPEDRKSSRNPTAPEYEAISCAHLFDMRAREKNKIYVTESVFFVFLKRIFCHKENSQNVTEFLRRIGVVLETAAY